MDKKILNQEAIKLSQNLNFNKTPVIEDIVNEGKTIYQKSKNFKKIHKNMDEKDYETLLSLIHKEHKDFVSVYAIVVKTIIYGDTFYHKALEKYINHLKNNPWNSREEFIDRQADWLIYLERERNPRIGSKSLAEFRQRIQKQLHEEDKEFVKAAEKMKKQLEVEHKEILKNRRERLIGAIKQLKSEGQL